MVPETNLKAGFFEKKILAGNEGNGSKMGFWNKVRLLFFPKVYISSYISAQIHISEKSGSWDMVQNAHSQSDFRIFKSLEN